MKELEPEELEEIRGGCGGVCLALIATIPLVANFAAGLADGLGGPDGDGDG